MSATAQPPRAPGETAAANGPAECPFHAAVATGAPGAPPRDDGAREPRLGTEADRVAAAALAEIAAGDGGPRRLGMPAALRVADRPSAGALPPGPQRAAFRQTLEWIRDPAGFMDRCAAEFGTTFTVRLGPAEVVMLSEPDDVRQVFHGPPEQMHMGEVNGLFRRVLGHDSLLVIDGEQHMHHRKLLLPPFQGRRIEQHQATMVAAAEDSVDRWPHGDPFSLHPHAQDITLDVILAAVFGFGPGERRDRFRVLVARMLDLCDTLAMTLPVLRHEVFGLSAWGRLMRCVREVDTALYAEIAARREDSEEHEDVLSLLLAARDEAGEPMTDRELRDQLLTLLVAGHETTATALAWAFERLLREPAVLARTRAEVDGGSTTYLDAVIKESLRLRPTLPIAARKLTSDFELGGRTYPAGTVLMPCIYLLHRNPNVWPEPDAFRPERFLDGKPPAYGWIPFGGGVRRCLGAGFALAEMRAVMQTVLRRMDLRPADPWGERIARRTFTLSPASGARVVATPR